MAAATEDSSSSHSYLSQIPYLSPQQQGLLLAALSSQKKNPTDESLNSLDTPQRLSTRANGLSPSSNASPVQNQVNDTAKSVDPSMLSSSVNGASVNLETPRRFADGPAFGSNLWAEFDANGGFNFDTVKDEFGSNGMNYDWMPDGSSPEMEPREKRKGHDSDSDDDDDQPANKAPNGKVSKKPGRKPLTSEPTNKRKAQNRAAQRAFRERKEQHLKDLEQKVEDLEHVTASTNQENGLLKAQIRKLQTEIDDYRKRLTVVSSALNGSSTDSFSSFAQRSSTDFNFDFPRFGSPNEMSSTQVSTSPFSANVRQDSSSATGTSQNVRNGSNGRSSLSPQSFNADSPSSMNGIMQSKYGLTDDSVTRKGASDVASGSSNSPGLWRSTSNMSGIKNYGGRGSQQLSPVGALSGYATSNIDSPPHLTPHNGSSSSCGTSPEPSNHIQGVSEGLSNNSNSMSNNANSRNNAVPPYPVTSQISEAEIDFSNFDWLTNNNGQFDPLLFGDYRESQDAIVGGGEFSGGLYDDTFDFTNPSDIGSSLFGKAKQPSPVISNASISNTNNNTNTNTNIIQGPTSLMEQVERQKEGAYEEQQQQASAQGDATKANGNRKGCPEMMTAKAIWTHLKTNPQFQSGEFDIDSLCSELSQKATCSETGMAIPTKHVEKVLWKLATNGGGNGSGSSASPEKASSNATGQSSST